MNGPSAHSVVESLARTDGAVLWTASQGTGEPVVLCHGGPGMRDNLGPVADMVDDLALVVRYDQRGCGRSTGHPPYSLSSYLDDLEWMRRHYGFRQWVVGGHSFGSCIAVAYAVARPENTRALLFLTMPFVDLGFMDAWAAAEAAKVAPYRPELQRLAAVMGQGNDAEAVAAHRKMLSLYYRSKFYDPDIADRSAEAIDHPPMNMAVNAALQRDWIAFVSDERNRDRVRKLGVPTLLLEPEADHIAQLSERNRTCLWPQIDYRLVERAGHFAWIEQPTAVRDLLRDFLLRLRDPSRGP